MRILKWILLICCVELSCTKPIDMKLPPHEPKLVLHGYVSTGEYFSVAIGRSMFSNEYRSGEESFVDNAWVALFENDVFRDSLRYDAAKKRYVSQTIKAEPGKKYTLRAGADGFPTIEATTIATNPVPTVSMAHVIDARTTFYGESLDDVTFSFPDAGNERNFYRVVLYPSYWGTSNINCVYSSDPAIERIQPDVVPTDDLSECISNEEVFFSDKSFNGTLKQMTISSRSAALKSMPDTMRRLHRPYIKRYSISEDYYRYLKNVISLTSYGETPIQKEPVLLKGNVQNGYGLFAVSAVTTDTLR